MDSSAAPRRRYVPDWMKLNFDRFSHATNLEEYGSSPPDTGSEFIRALDMKLGQAAEGHSNNQVPSVLLNSVAAGKQDQTLAGTAAATMGVEKRSHKRLHRRHPHHELQRPLSSPQFENVLDSCLSYSSCSSAEVTPAVTPQSSPCLSRRILNQENLFQPPQDASSKKQQQQLLPITESSEIQAVGSMAVSNQQNALQEAKKRMVASKACMSKAIGSDSTAAVQALGHKKYLVTNFDINAVGPTSW